MGRTRNRSAPHCHVGDGTPLPLADLGVHREAPLVGVPQLQVAERSVVYCVEALM